MSPLECLQVADGCVRFGGCDMRQSSCRHPCRAHFADHLLVVCRVGLAPAAGIDPLTAEILFEHDSHWSFGHWWGRGGNLGTARPVEGDRTAATEACESDSGMKWASERVVACGKSPRWKGGTRLLGVPSPEQLRHYFRLVALCIVPGKAPGAIAVQIAAQSWLPLK